MFFDQLSVIYTNRTYINKLIKNKGKSLLVYTKNNDNKETEISAALKHLTPLTKDVQLKTFKNKE